MVYLGLEPRAAGWKVKTYPLIYVCGQPVELCYSNFFKHSDRRFNIFYPNRARKITLKFWAKIWLHDLVNLWTQTDYLIDKLGSVL